MTGGSTAAAPQPVPGQRLRRMRAIATTLLAAMTALFVVTTFFLPTTPLLGAVRAFAEAALIGGLADWFAVVALFRRPLGLPIPHTAIVPARKNEIGRGLARFIRDHFLVREAVERQLGRARLAARLGDWLEDDGNASRASQDICGALIWALRGEGGKALRAALAGNLTAALEQVPANHVVSTLLEVLTTGSRLDGLIDEFVRLGRSTLDEHRFAIRLRIREQSPWWLPKFVDEEIYDKLMNEIAELLDAIAHDRDHPARLEVRNRLEAFRHAMTTDATLIADSGDLKRELALHPAVRSFAAATWHRLRSELLAALDDDASPLRQAIGAEVRRLGSKLKAGSALAAELDDWLARALLHIVDHYRDPLSDIVAETIEGWDATATAERIEQNIGTDLQFIRLNGTLVGGLVGLLIYAGSRLVA